MCAVVDSRRALLLKKLRLLPCRKVTAFIDLVVINEFVIRALCPTPRGFIVFAGKDGHRRRNGDIDGVVKADLIFPIKPSRRNHGVRQPIKCDVVEDIIARKVACGAPIDGTPENGRGDRRRRLGITIAVVKKPGGHADGRIRESA
jgi:hypothetical protein